MRICVVIPIVIVALGFVYKVGALPIFSAEVHPLIEIATNDHSPFDISGEHVVETKSETTQYLSSVFKSHYCDDCMDTSIKHQRSSRISMDDATISTLNNMQKRSIVSETLKPRSNNQANLIKRFWNMRYYCGWWACMHAK